MNKTKRNCYRTNKGDKFQRPTACLAICINLAPPRLAIHFPACAQLCFWNSVSALNYPQVLHRPNDFSIHNNDSLAPWPHNFSSFFFSVIFNFTVYQEPTHVATPWSQSSDESTLPEKFWIVSFPLYPQPPTFCLSYSHWTCHLSLVWPPIFFLIVYLLLPTFSYLPKLWEPFYQPF